MAYVNKSDIYKLFDESNGVIRLHIADVDMLPNADVEEVKKIKIIRDDLKWWLETNNEKGVVHIPKFVVENMIAKMDSQL